MTELATYDAAPTQIALGTTIGLDLGPWAEALGTAMRIAKALCGTALVPKQYQGKPEDGAAAIMYGAGIGLNPLQALQNIYVVHGTPSLSARGMVGVVLARGHAVWTEHDTPERVVVCGRRADWPADRVESADWTIERARKAGYTAQNKAQYDTKPQEMLWARAASTICRKIAPDALLGMSYSTEELRASGPIEVVTEAPARRTAAQILAAPVEHCDPETGEVSGELPIGEPA